MKFLDFLKYNRESFGAKIFYLSTIFIVIIYLSFTAFFIYYQSKMLKKNLISEGEQLASLLAYSSRLGVFAENEDLLKGPIEGIVQNKEVMLVQIFTVDGKKLKTLRRPGKETKNLPISPSNKRRRRGIKKGGNEGRFWEQKTIDMLKKSKSPFYSALILAALTRYSSMT